MSEKNYLNILRGGVYASFLILFFVFSSFYFPFITSKQISFNLLIEVLLIVLLIFLLKYPQYRPRRSALSLSLLLYFLAIAVSLLVSVDFNLSFWGDTERMLGFFSLSHFFFFYLIIITTFRNRNDYQNLLKALLASAVLVSLWGIIKKTPHSTIGNVAYTAAIALFALFLEVKFFIKSRQWWQKLIYTLAFLISLVGFVQSDISGSQVGLLAGVFISIITLIIISHNKKLRYYSLAGLAIFILLVAGLFLFRQHSVFDGTFVGKALRDFSKDNITLNTRLISYRAAAHYLEDHPQALLFGVGHGNYALIFDQYFNPDFYNYDRGATYFDRAHSTPVDIITTTGLLGLLTYLAIFIVLFIFLVKAYRRGVEAEPEFGLDGVDLALILGLVAAYFVQNLAVFDSFATYLYFMIILAFVNYLRPRKEKQDLKSNNFRGQTVLSILLIVSLLGAISLQVNSFKLANGGISAHKKAYSHGLLASLEDYQELFALNTGLERDLRNSFIDLVVERSAEILTNKDPRVSEKLEELIDFSIEVAEKNESYNYHGSLALNRLSRVYDLASRFYQNQGNSDKAVYYSQQSLEALDRSIEASPGRVPLYLSRSDIYLDRQDKAAALADLEKARDLNPLMPDPYCYLSRFYLLEGDYDQFLSYFSDCGHLNGKKYINWSGLISLLESRLIEENKLEELISFYDLVLEFQEINEDLITNLSVAYYYLGDLESAKNTIQRLLEIDKRLEPKVEAFLLEIGADDLD